MSFEIITFEKFTDHRGSLVAIDKFDKNFFEPKRSYFIYDTPKDVYRGFHSHHLLKQLVVCLSGSFVFNLHDGERWHEYTLNSPNKALLIDKPAWREFVSTSDNSVLLVFASEYYDESDYVYDFDEFKLEMKNKIGTEQ